MKRDLLRKVAYLQIALAILMATGCTSTQPFFLNESPDLQYYLNSATRIEYPDVEVDSLPDTTQTEAPLTLGNHEYQFWDLTLEDCVTMALQNGKILPTTGGNAEFRQNVSAQITSSNVEQVGTIYDVAVQQATTQSIPLTVDSNGNRTLPRGVVRSNQVGGVEDALAEFDAQYSSFVTYSTTDRPRNTGNSGVSITNSTGADLNQQSALSKRFATGGVATLRQQIIYNRSNLPTLTNPILGGPQRLVSSDYTFLVEAQVQHPLMRNRGTLVNRIPVVLASLNEDIALTDYEIQVRNLVRDVETAYWDLYIAYRNVATSAVARNSAIATAKFAQLNLKNGTGTIQDLEQANGQYHNFVAQLNAALAGSNIPGEDRFGVYGSERELRALMGIASTDGRLVRPIDEPTTARLEFDWNETLTQMLYLSPELRRGRINVKQRELEKISAKNQVLPEVNLSLLYRWVGVGDTLGVFNGSNNVPAPQPGSQALETFASGDFQEGQVQLQFTPSAIGARRELARVRGSNLQLVRAQAFLQDAERLMARQLSDAVAKTYSHYGQVQAYAQAWQATEAEVNARLKEFVGGRATINVVLQSQQRRAQAQISYYRAVAEYNKSINYVDYLRGTLLANSNVTLAEGPWNKKAYWDALERARERSAGKKVVYGVTRPGVVRTGPVQSAPGSINDAGRAVDLSMPRSPVAPPMEMSLGEMGPTPIDMIDNAPAVQSNEGLPLNAPENFNAPNTFNAPMQAPSMDSGPSRLQPMPTPFDASSGGASVVPISHQLEPVANRSTIDHGRPAPVRRTVVR